MAQAPDVPKQFMKRAMNAPFLERTEEHSLAVRWKEKRDEGALHELAHAHMRLVIAMAMRFRHYGLPVSDLIQEGHIGLLEAAARFDPDREVRFSTYATWWIRASMQDYILRNWSIVRGGTSSSQKALFFNLRRLRAKLSRDTSDDSGRVFNDIAMALGVSRSDVETMHGRLSAPDSSLSAPVSDEEGAAERGDFLVDERPLPDENTESIIDGERRHKMLWRAFECLTDREKRIILARKLNDESVTLDSLGNELGISKERVRQIENRAIEKLREQMVGAQAM